MNDSAISLADARPLVASPLWSRIRAFLWQFETLCDASRLRSQVQTFASSHVPSSDPAVPPDGEPESDGEVAEPSNFRTFELANALATTPRVAASALRALGLSPFFHSFPATDASRLLLLSREDYDRLAQFLGVVAFAPALRRVTAGADVRALRAALPGVYPATLAFTAYFRKHEPLFKQVAFKESSQVPKFESSNVPDPEPANPPTCQPANIMGGGHRLLAAALSDLPPALLLRQRLRFPEGSPADAALAREASPDGRAPSRPDSPAAFAAAKLALKLSNPAESAVLFP